MEQETLFPLLRGTAQGNREDFAELYKVASPQVFAVVLKLLKHKELAEEATQDAFIKVQQITREQEALCLPGLLVLPATARSTCFAISA